MNRIYRSIWNAKTATFVAASENAKNGGKKAPPCASADAGVARFALKAVAVSLMLAFGLNVYANPTGGAVSAGAASIAGGAGKMTINQTTQNVAINWQGFSIGQGEAVNFVQPATSSVALNRVLGPDPSNILGSLSANGKVFLVNPNGILFGKGASVNVGGLVASTRNISDSDFMAGQYKFSGTGNGTVVNKGSINADGGYVALLGAAVSNEGVIVAQLGTVALVAGNAVTLDVAGDGLLNVAVSQGAVNALAQNGGLIQADGGQVLLSAQSAGSLLQSVVNNTGVIQAQTIQNHNGTITLLADMQSGTVNIGGTLDVSGKAGQTGGSVTATARHVGLFGGHIDASGDAGGGTVLIGGGYQGKDPLVQNASAAYMSADSTISADAVTNGSGGKVVLWSTDSTRAYGNITARGGAQGGDGGLIETSGHWLDVTGINLNASAANGKNGTWLLDPADVTISAGATSNDTLTAGVFSPDPGQGTANINAGALQLLLNGGTDITITATNTGAAGIPLSGRGDINVNAALTWTRVLGQPNVTLTLNAAGDVNINQTITATRGNLVVCCGRDITVAAIAVGSRITTTNGSVLLSAGRDVLINGATTTTDGNFAMCAGRDINVNAAMTLTNGNVVADQSLASLGVRQGMTLSAGTAANGPGLAGGGGAVNIAPPGGVITVTQGGAPGTAAPVLVIYNPLSYAAPATNFSGNFTAGTPLTVQRLVFPAAADKVFDGTPAATFTSLLKTDALGNSPAGVTLATVGTGTFDTAAVGVGKTITFTSSGFTLGGAGAAGFAIPVSCCAPLVGITTANITPVIAVVPPVVVVPPAVVPPVAGVPGVGAPVVVVPGVAPFAEAQFVVLPLVAMQESVFDSSLNLAVIGTGVNMPPPVTLAGTTVIPPPVVPPPVQPPAAVAPPERRALPLPPPRKDRN